MPTPEEHWRSNPDYHERQGEVGGVTSNIALFDRIYDELIPPRGIIEFGAGAGRNLEAIKQIDNSVRLVAVELDKDASGNIDADIVLNMNMLDYNPDDHVKADMTFTKGVLIHIAPENIQKAYEVLYESSLRYVLVAEYYNPNPIAIKYRGDYGLLWKRDFAGEMMDKYPDLKLIDYGFVYHRDEFPQDDITWFLMEKVDE